MPWYEKSPITVIPRLFFFFKSLRLPLTIRAQIIGLFHVDLLLFYYIYVVYAKKIGRDTEIMAKGKSYLHSENGIVSDIRRQQSFCKKNFIVIYYSILQYYVVHHQLGNLHTIL